MVIWFLTSIRTRAVWHHATVRRTNLRVFGSPAWNADAVDAALMLSSAGWFPGRVVGISRAERAYAGERLGLHEAARALLREFSGLTVWGKEGSQCLTFDGEQALRRTDPAWSRAYSEDSGRTLLPVGEYSHAVILVDETGCLWGGFDDLYGQLADSVVDLVHELFIEPSRRFDRQLRDED
jgi:hypothetical protein